MAGIGCYRGHKKPDGAYTSFYGAGKGDPEMKVFDFLTHKYGKYSIFAFILVIAFSALSTLLLGLLPNVYNPLVQFLFDVLLFIASVWFGVSISNEEARKSVSRQWLHAAEIAGMELLAMSETAKRMRWRQGGVCHSIDKIIPDLPPRGLESVQQLIGISCGGCAANMADLQNHIDNIYQQWSRFISTNCDESECDAFHDLLRKRQLEIQATFDSQPFDAGIPSKQSAA